MSIAEDESGLDIPYPPGHNWEGYTPRQISEAYAKLDKDKKTDKPMKKYTKLYIVSGSKAKSTAHITFLLNSHNLWINKIWPIAQNNWIVKIEYENSEDVNRLIGKHFVHGVRLQVYRIFKSMKLHGKKKEEPQYSFLDKVMILISARFKTKALIRVVNNNANDWQKMLLTRWQEEIERPNKFKRLGIIPNVDIAPDGEVFFHINKVGDYIITYFGESLLLFDYEPTQK